ncbi:zf-HC2 domain-containing protein [Paenibacillus sp. KS-LC4]|uniref:zf-HC2 domain-containing protein n=1 Tax=Paenibacillus sp. KS-LC4 TaxID=2979727 RepID=UPI0030CE024F
MSQHEEHKHGESSRTKQQGKHVNHVEASLLEQYVANLLSEPEREQIERQLAGCDECLERFMYVLEADMAGAEFTSKLHAEGASPLNLAIELPDFEQMGSKLSRQLFGPSESEKQQLSMPGPFLQEKSFRRRSWLQHPATHYTAAAVITLLLLGTGVLNNISQELEKIDHSRLQHKEEQFIRDKEQRESSWSQQMMNRTSLWLDGIASKRFK